MPSVVIVEAVAREQIQAARRLFEEYAASLGFELCFQNFQQELEELPGKYAPPEGRLLLAMLSDDEVGCVAVRKLDAEICEMKRLYVCPKARGLGLGRRLAVEIISEARSIGYHAMRLDTLRSMEAATTLYRALGFREIAPYYPNPLCGATYLELDLTAAPTLSR